MKYFSVFTGAGGFEQGMPIEWECIGMSEIDKYANMVLKHHYPNIKNYGDINGIDWTQIPDFDLLIGGSPCQDLSLAGKRKGLSGERSGLFFAFTKALRDKLPNYFIWENVKGALSSNQGWDFAEVLNQFSALGYNLWWQVLNAKDFGVPQNRERIFIIGVRSGSPKEIFYKPSKSRGAIELTQEQSQGYRIYSTEGTSTTLAGPAGGVGAKTGLYQILSHSPRSGDPTKGGTGPLTSSEYAFTVDSTPNMVVQPVLTPNRAKKRQNGRRKKEAGEDMFTLTGQDVHGVAIFDYRSDEGIRVRKNGQAPSLTSHGDSAGGIPVPMISAESQIRRLTPLECERLMSWQDGWTKYGVDEKGNKVEISDTQRYKMCGNGVVSNVIKEITGKIL